MNPSANGGLFQGLCAQAKLVSLLGLAIITVSIPATNHAQLAGCGALVLMLMVMARLGFREVAQRFLKLAPFLAVAVLLPLTHPQGGTAQAIGEMAKAMIGCGALVVLSATTPTDRLLSGLAGLRCPPLVVLLLSTLIRYLHLLGDEARRLRRAAAARGYNPRFIWQATIIGQLIGALFLRSHARAERVHFAMLARGFNGTVMTTEPEPFTAKDACFMVTLLGLVLTWRIVGP